MDPERDDGLPALAALPHEVIPDKALEDRTVGALRRQGLLRIPRARMRPLWQIAAALVLFVGGVAVGRATSSGSQAISLPGAPRFLLLLHGGPTGLSDAEESKVVAEYGAWAVMLRSQGRFVSGERLGEVGTIVPPGTLPGVGGLRGFFLISAPSFDDAVAVARSCPHARRGGHVIVRPIDPT